MERTLDCALKAKNDTYSQFDSEQLKNGAWEDCMELYDRTIHRLNQSVSCPEDVCSRSDVHAWLSTALTNLETCREGMSELCLSSDSLQGIIIDVTNALAISKTIVTGDRSKGRGFSTFKSATGRGRWFGGETHDDQDHSGAGEQAGGYQDTLYVHSGRQFFRECNIYDTVDFIFGNAAAVFQNCSILTLLTSMGLICYDGGDRNVPWSFD
ncbi:unnamed protein product [Brassica oleracea]